MILWAIVICAVVGFALGTHCRLLPLAATSVLVAACVPFVMPATDSALVFGSLAILGLLAVLQAFFLVGAMVRVSGPGVPFSGAVLGERPGFARHPLMTRAAASSDID